MSCGKSEVFLGVSDFFVEVCVFGEQFLDSLFVGFGLVRSGAEPAFEFVDFAAEFGELGSGEPKSLLMLLHLASESPDFIGAFLGQSVESLALLSEDRHFVLPLSL